MVKQIRLNKTNFNYREFAEFLKECKGNWRQNYRYWYPTHPENDPDQIGDDQDNWASWIIFNRDSVIADQVNHDVVKNSIIGSMSDDIVPIYANCTGNGWVRGFAFRLWTTKKGKKRPSKVAMLFFQIQSFMHNCYSLLDEDTVIEREFEAKQDSVDDFIRYNELEDYSEQVHELASNLENDGHGAISWERLKNLCDDAGLFDNDEE